MNSLEKILVVIDGNSDQQLALSRAAHLARCTGAKITAMLTIYDLSYEMTTMLSDQDRHAMRNAVILDREQWLQKLIDDNYSDLASIDINVEWHSRPFEAIIEAVIEHDYDLVVKSTRQHDTLKSLIFTPTDWHLLRKCPSPVLLVKEVEWQKQGKILAAVHTGSDGEHHSSLNEKILDTATGLAAHIDANVHLVNAYPGTPVNIAIEIPEFDPNEYNNVVREHHESAVSELLSKFKLDQSCSHIREGLPEDVIPKVSQQIEAELLVIGTIGRTGFSAAIIGNTAEHVIDQINCDILAIKPDGYVSPLKQN